MAQSMVMVEKSLNLGHLAEEFSKLLVDFPTPVTTVPTVELEEGERREVTILFLDLVGYTKLAERLDPEQLKFVISNTLQVFTNQIKKCGGTVEKYVGDAIMALFGRAEAHEDDSHRAVTAARSILDRLEDINSILAQKGINISARIGVNRGLIVTGQLGEHDTVTGEAINIAQRLEANAPENGILISDSVYEDCREYYQCESLPPMHVKNKTEPLTVYRVEGDIQQARVVHAVREGPFVGRSGESHTMRAAWERAGGGQMNITQILGVAGIGKTALMQHVLSDVCGDEGDVQPIYVSADSFGMTPFHALNDIVKAGLIPYQGSLEIFCEAVTTPETQTVLADYRIYLADLLGHGLTPEEQEQLEQMEPRARQAETYLALKRFLLAAAAIGHAKSKQPLPIIIDNFQWVAHASREAMTQILQTFPQDSTILWVFIGRGEEGANWLPPQVSASVMHLASLPEDAVAEFIRDRLADAHVTDDFCRQIHDRTGGNPFFLREVISELSDVGSVAEFSFAERLPSTIKAMVLSRLDRLPRPLKFAMQVASIAGREFSDSLLTHVITLVHYPFDVSQLIQDLQGEKLVHVDEGRMVMAQPMMTEVAYSTILYANRRKLHRIVAQWVEERQAETLPLYAAYLADQWERAEEPGKASPYCLEAGKSARQRYAHRDAAAFFERALRLSRIAHDPLSNDVIVEILQNLADVYDSLGDPDKWRHYVHEGLSKTDPGSRIHAVLRLREIELENRYGDRQAAPQLLAEFLKKPFCAEHVEVRLRALIDQSMFAFERGEDDTQYIEKAEALRPDIQDPRLLYLLDNTVFNHHKNSDELKQAEAYFNRVLKAAANNPYNQHLSDLFFCSFMWDRGAAFDHILERATRAGNYFREVGWVRGVGWGAFYRGAAQWRLGQFLQAHETFTRGIQEMEQARDQYLIERLELLLAALFLFRGETVGYQLRKNRIMERAEALPQKESQAMHCEFAMFEGQALIQRHELSKVYEELKSAGSDAVPKVEFDEYTVTLAHVASQLGHPQEAEALIEQVREHILANEKHWLAGLLARVEGQLAADRQEYDVMHRGFGESIVYLQRVGAQFDCYQTYQAWWRAIKKHGLEKTPEGASVNSEWQKLESWRPRSGDNI